MTRLTYKIGNVEVVSYRMARELKRKTGLPIYKIYTEVEEDFKEEPEKRDKRAAAIYNKAHKRA